MALSKEPTHRSPGQQQECFPYIDRVIRLDLIMRDPRQGNQYMYKISHMIRIILNRVIGQMTDAVAPRVPRSNGENPRRGRADKAGGGEGSGGAVSGSMWLTGSAPGPGF